MPQQGSPADSQGAPAPQTGDALVVVDLQRDFLPGGALAVPHGDEVVDPLNRYLGLFAAAGLPVFATRDWHPAAHCSFAARGGPWPPHCVMNTPGAEFSPLLQLRRDVEIISKASDPDRDSYSAFGEPGFEERLRELEVKRLWIGGLATEYCVRSTVRDAIGRGFRVQLLTDAVRAVDVQPGDGARAIDEMRRLGAKTRP
jgi:nicotinamidase/pyrazinamidase